MLNVKNTLTVLKVRASYGTLGNQSIGGYYPAFQTLTISSMSANDKIYPIVALNTLANKDITWETSEMYDAGIRAFEVHTKNGTNLMKYGSFDTP